jgi:hypothetical protein
VSNTPTYDDGAALGCPDCIGGEEHCCPFLFMDAQPEPRRSWALDHMRRYFKSVEMVGVSR